MPDEEEIGVPSGNATIQDRIAAFAMLDAMSEATVAAKIHRLSLVGFKRNEIAAMMQTTAGMVNQSIYEQKHKKKPAAKKPATKA